MPYVDLVSDQDFVSLWYTTNSPHNNVGSFDPAKGTLLMLHPLFLDSSWLRLQFEDPRLNTYNIIAFDSRVAGRSKARPSSLHDSWVDAADLAFAAQALHLPPAHILALETASINCALRFAALFPEMCSSLSLCGVPPPTELGWVFNHFDELLQSWSYAEDLESFEHAGKEAVGFVAGPNCDPDLQDELIAFWETSMPPSARLRQVEYVNVVMNRQPMTTMQLAAITAPVLIVQGERNEPTPVNFAHELAEGLKNAKNGAQIFVIKGAIGNLAVLPANASWLNRVVSKFLQQVGGPPNPSVLRPPPIPVTERMTIALARLAELTGDATIANRNPTLPLSFSCAPEKVRKSQMESLKFYAAQRSKAFSPLGPDGRPMRKYSERSQGHWFSAGHDGYSLPGANVLSRHQRKMSDSDTVRPPVNSLAPSETLVSPDDALKRATFSPSTADKVVIKGSMTKVVTAAVDFPLKKIKM